MLCYVLSYVMLCHVILCYSITYYSILRVPSRDPLLEGWNTVGSLIEICWLKKAYRGPQFTGI